MLCILCLKKKSKQIKICSKKGQELNCSNVIAKHFWIQPSTQRNSKESVCLVCWDAVSNFNKFYQSVVEAHNFLESENVHFNTPRQECLNGEVPKPKKESVNLSNDQLFDAEVKLELDDLDYLPGTEVIENVYGSNDCFEKDIKSNLQLIDDSNNNENSSNTQIKQEPASYSGDDSESDIPLSIFLRTDLKIDDKSELHSIQTKESPNHVISSSSSNSSSNENLDCESDGLDNREETEQFAEIIPKRAPAKLKTYRKRTKPTSSKRKLKKGFGSKLLQQEKYDQIIAKLFDKFPCRICKLFVRNFGDMRSHFKMAHQGSHPSVECCERRFHKRLTLADHVLVHLNPEHFKCSKCGEFLKDSITLKEHEDSHDLPPDQLKGKKGFSCHICSKQLSSKSGVEKHILIKHVPKSEYKFPCAECDKMFPTKHILKKHVTETHRGARSVICDQCGKTLQTSYILKKHIAHEHLNIPRPEPVRVQCTLCQVWLRDIYGLRNHMQCAHDQSEGEHRCDICGYLSVNARSLKRHKTYIHKLERKFQCSLCEKAFRRPNELHRHNLTHTGETVICEICPMTFGSRASYYNHRRKVHGYQPKPNRRIGLNKKPKEIKSATKRKRKIKSENINTEDVLQSEKGATEKPATEELLSFHEADKANVLTSKEPNLQELFQSVEPNTQDLGI